MNHLLDLLAYHRWATERTLEAVSTLEPDAFTQQITSSFPSLRDTLVHTFGADRAWLGRLEGQAPTRTEPTEYPNVATLRTNWMSLLERWPEVVASFQDENTPISYRSFAGDPFTNTLGEIVRHTVNHGTYHFGQVTTMLRQLGAQPTSLDLIAYYRQKNR
jgi:uncharacterized damage-inducible protein DinB